MPDPGRGRGLERRHEQTVLGFDHGLKRIGVAVGQTVSASASPLGILRARDGKPCWNEVHELINRWQPDRLIVGLALDHNGELQNGASLAKRFANQLNGRHQLPVELVDEYASSKQAESRKRELRASGGLTREQGRYDDAVAAQLIVERWLAQYA